MSSMVTTTTTTITEKWDLGNGHSKVITTSVYKENETTRQAVTDLDTDDDVSVVAIPVVVKHNGRKNDMAHNAMSIPYEPVLEYFPDLTHFCATLRNTRTGDSVQFSFKLNSNYFYAGRRSKPSHWDWGDACEITEMWGMVFGE